MSEVTRYFKVGLGALGKLSEDGGLELLFKGSKFSSFGNHMAASAASPAYLLSSSRSRCTRFNLLIKPVETISQLGSGG